MGKGTGSGKGSGKGDAASTIGKALTCVSGITIFMGFIALIIAAAVISRTVDESKMKACGNDSPESYPLDCAQMGYNSRRLVSSGSVTAADPSDSFHMRFAHDVVASVDKQIHKAGQRQRKLTHSSSYTYDNCGLTQSQMCQPATLTTQEEEDAISGIRMYAMISGALASIGALPALAGGIAKTLGKQGLSDGCGMLALCSTCFLSCCGALAFAAIPFTFAAIISTLCTQVSSSFQSKFDI